MFRAGPFDQPLTSCRRLVEGGQQRRRRTALRRVEASDMQAAPSLAERCADVPEGVRAVPRPRHGCQGPQLGVDRGRTAKLASP